MGITEPDPSRWGRAGTWAVESREAAFARAPEIGRRFFQAIFEEFPEADGVRFLRRSAQPEEVYADLDLPGGGAGIQVDPYPELLIVWGGDGQTEYGDWDLDQVPPAVDDLRRRIRCDRGGTDDAPPLVRAAIGPSRGA